MQRMRSAEPTPSRPRIPGYGVPTGDEGLLPWSHVTGRLEEARNYWVATAGPDGQPHAVPVWGAWVEDIFYFGVGPRSERSLAANPAVAVHLESGDDVVILEGASEVVTELAPDDFARMADAFAAKYDGYRPDSAEGMRALRPRVVYAWSQFPANATRWRFAASH